MTWETTAQIATIVLLYIGGIATIGYYITNSLGKRIDGLDKRIDDLRDDVKEFRSELKGDNAELRTELKGEIAELRTELKGDITEFRTEMKKEHASLASKVDSLGDELTKHLTDRDLHN